MRTLSRHDIVKLSNEDMDWLVQASAMLADPIIEKPDIALAKLAAILALGDGGYTGENVSTLLGLVKSNLWTFNVGTYVNQEEKEYLKEAEHYARGLAHANFDIVIGCEGIKTPKDILWLEEHPSLQAQLCHYRNFLIPAIIDEAILQHQTTPGTLDIAGMNRLIDSRPRYLDQLSSRTRNILDALQ